MANCPKTEAQLNQGIKRDILYRTLNRSTMYIAGRTYKIFVSSTFQDMDLERDVLRHMAIPQLNQKYAKYNIEFQAIDLRYGINTQGLSEEEATNKVLSTCIDSIEESQPFFISFIGNRYGSIPRKEDWQKFYNQLDDNQRNILKDSSEMSITEMEIHYTKTYSKLYDNDFNCMFFIRSEESLQSLPKKRYPEFIETQTEKNKKLTSLKETITELCKTPKNSSYSYSIDYDKPEVSKAALCKIITDALAGYIDTHLMKHSLPDIEKAFMEWERESSNTVSYFTKLYRGSIPREGEDLINEGNVLILGSQFSGKSTYLARQYIKLLTEDRNTSDDEARKILLITRVNSSKHSRTMLQIMGRWTIELAKIINFPINEDLTKALTNPSKESKEGVISMFYTAVDIIRNAGHSVHIFMDDIDKFAISSPGDELLKWVDERVTMYVTASSVSGIMETLMGELPFMICTPMDTIIDDKMLYIDKIEETYVCELPKAVKHEVANHKTNFLNLKLLFTYINLLNHEDFSNARSNSDYSSNMEKVIIDFFTSIPEDYHDALNYLIDLYSKKTNSGRVYHELVDLLKHSPVGLCDVDIIKLTSNALTIAELYQMIHHFKIFIELEKETGIVKLKHPNYNITSYGTYIKIHDYVQDLPLDDSFSLIYNSCNMDDSHIPDPHDREEVCCKVYTSISRYKYDEALSIIDWLLRTCQDTSLEIYKLIHIRMNILAYKDRIADAATLMNVLLKKAAGQEDIYTELEASLHAYVKHDYEEALSCGLLMQECIESFFKSMPFCIYIYYSYIADILYESRSFEDSLEYRKMAIEVLKNLEYAIEACYAYSYIKYGLACYYDKFSEGYNAYNHDDELNYAIEAEKIIEHRNLKGDVIGQMYIMMAEIYRFEHRDLELAIKYYEKAHSRMPSDNEATKDIAKIIKKLKRLFKKG